MSKKCISFLMDSFLYASPAVDSNYSSYTEQQIIIELRRYREYVLKNISKIQSEIKSKQNKLNVNIETFSSLPKEDLYKQLVLYMDQVIIPDPLFKLTEEKSGFGDCMGQLMGFQNDSVINRKKLADIINYIKCISSLIDGTFVVMLPISFIHETPKEIPINYSPTAFADIIPKSILNHYKSIVEVYNLEKCDGGVKLDRKNKLTLGTRIAIDFPDEIKKPLHMFQYITQDIIEFDKETGQAEVCMYEPKSISSETFNFWVNQSINQAANSHFNQKYNELIFAKKCGCMYLAQSPLTAKVLQMNMDKVGKEGELANMAMQLDLPVLNQLPLIDILEIRNNYGEAFHNFRNTLNSKLLALDGIEDSEKFKRQLDTIAYELTDIQVKDIEKEYRQIKKTLKWDIIACTGSLIASFATGGLTAVVAAGAFVKGISDIGKYHINIGENNGLFLWKLQQQAEKYKV